jgi:hypothetical protein
MLRRQRAEKRVGASKIGGQPDGLDQILDALDKTG